MTKEKLKQVVRKDGKRGSPKLSPNIKNFIIDIDGVVCEDISNEEPERMKAAAEIPSAKEKINTWYAQGHIITFFTARTKALKDITVQWLKDHGFKYHNIIFGKPRGGNYHYVDDKDIETTKLNNK